MTVCTFVRGRRAAHRTPRPGPAAGGAARTPAPSAAPAEGDADGGEPSLAALPAGRFARA